jgi:hypothetical protein
MKKRKRKRVLAAVALVAAAVAEVVNPLSINLMP